MQTGQNHQKQAVSGQQQGIYGQQNTPGNNERNKQALICR